MKTLVVVAFLAASACAGSRASGVAGPHASAESALVLVRCEVVDATIWVDDHPVAQIRDARGGLRLHAGAHHVEVRHNRFHTRYYELQLASGETKTIDVSLVEVLD